VIDRAQSLLQENYQYTITRRGSDMTAFLVCAPVLLAGEDVPVRSLLGKVVRTDLVGRKGDHLPENLPRFPVLEWLQAPGKAPEGPGSPGVRAPAHALPGGLAGERGGRRGGAHVRQLRSHPHRLALPQRVCRPVRGLGRVRRICSRP